MTDTATLTVQQMDPRTLLVDRNVRREVRLDPDFVASIKANGVLQAIVAVLTAEGQTRVRMGQRRTLGAIEADLALVPVVVVGNEATTKAGEIDRLVAQFAENEHRTGLTVGERAEVAAQMSLLGVSAAQITKRTRMTREDVDAALTVASSDLAKGAVERYDFLDLTQAATLAEFDTDTEAVTALVAAAKTGMFAHTAQRLRDARTAAERRAEVETELREAGVTVVQRPAYDATAKPLDSLLAGDGYELTVENHAQCPGHAAFAANLHGYVDPVTGEPVPESSVDEDDEDEVSGAYDEADCCTSCEAHISDPHGPGCAQGAIESEAADTRPRWASYVGARYVCTDPKAHGHVERFSGHDSGSGRKTAAEMTDTEREAARAERRDVIDSNKAWASAETVRRDWLRTFLTRKTAPKGSAGLVGTAVAVDATLLADVGGNHLAADLFGCDSTGYGRNDGLPALVAAASEARAQVLTLGMVLAAYEAHTDRSDWRAVRPATRRYLAFLAANGYTLSNVERRAGGEDPLPEVDTD